jgi:prolycopene isomerase
MQSEFDFIIIVAGLGGLSVASLLAKQGKRVIVFEKHTKPGGYATNFTRGDFTFDVALHSMNGIRPGSPTYQCLKEIGILDHVDFLPQKSLYRLVTAGENIIVKHGGIKEYIDFLKNKFPDERLNIERLFFETENVYKEVKRLMSPRFPFWFRMATAPVFLRRLMRYEKSTVNDFFHYSQEMKALGSF